MSYVFNAPRVIRFNVQKTEFGTALYLAHDADLSKIFWTSNPDLSEPYEYDNEDEAQEDADIYGGEVFTFRRLARRSDLEFTHDSEAARLAYHFSHAAE